MKKPLLSLVFFLGLSCPVFVYATAADTNNSNFGTDPNASRTYADPFGDAQSSDRSGAQSQNGSFTPLAPIPGLTDSQSANSVINSNSLANFFNNLYKYLIGLAAVLAVIEIIWGGLEISTKDSVSSHSNGKERIQQALLGLVLILSPVIVFSIINPSILNLSLNLPKLDTKTGTPIQAPSTLPTCTGGQRAVSGKCITATPTQMGNSASPTPGLYCFERTNPNAPNDFVCMSTQAGCEKLFNDNMQFGDKSAVSSCKQY